MIKTKVLKPLLHGKQYQAGDDIELTDAEYAANVEAGTVAKTVEVPATNTKTISKKEAIPNEDGLIGNIGNGPARIEDNNKK